jgi:hypothetical protein
MSGYTLTIRNGPRVERDRFDDLDSALDALRDRCEEIRAEGPLPDVSMIREYRSEQRVKARLEISTGRIFGKREAGVDVMGDGAVVPFSGGTFRRPIPDAEADYKDAIARALRE